MRRIIILFIIVITLVIPSMSLAAIVAWDREDDNPGVYTIAGYYIYYSIHDSENWTTSQRSLLVPQPAVGIVPTYDLTNLNLSAGSYDFYATAIDTAGNESGPSNVINIAWVYPSGLISRGVGGNIYLNQNASVSVSRLTFGSVGMITRSSGFGNVSSSGLGAITKGGTITVLTTSQAMAAVTGSVSISTKGTINAFGSGVASASRLITPSYGGLISAEVGAGNATATILGSLLASSGGSITSSVIGGDAVVNIIGGIGQALGNNLSTSGSANVIISGMVSHLIGGTVGIHKFVNMFINITTKIPSLSIIPKWPNISVIPR